MYFLVQCLVHTTSCLLGVICSQAPTTRVASYSIKCIVYHFSTFLYSLSLFLYAAGRNSFKLNFSMHEFEVFFHVPLTYFQYHVLG